LGGGAAFGGAVFFGGFSGATGRLAGFAGFAGFDGLAGFAGFDGFDGRTGGRLRSAFRMDAARAVTGRAAGRFAPADTVRFFAFDLAVVAIARLPCLPGSVPASGFVENERGRAPVQGGRTGDR
jgi:hypothetical protein